MKTQNRYRRLLLFLIALILPSLAAVTLGFRMIAQERELSEKRLMDGQRQAVTQIHQNILARLDRIKLQEISTASKTRAASDSDTAVAIVGWADRDRFDLPWDSDKGAEEFRKAIGDGQFLRKVEEGEQAEFAERRYDHAAALYREALNLAVDPKQSVHARNLLAGALARSNRRDEARLLDRSLLDLPAEIVDEHGTPFAFYAAQRLLDLGSDASRPEVNHAVVNRLHQELASLPTRTPAQIYTLNAIIQKLEKSADSEIRKQSALLASALAARKREVDQALALQSDFPSLRLTASRWVSYGVDPWLVGITPTLPNSRSAVIAVRARDIFQSVASDQSASPGTPYNIAVEGGSGEPLGDSLPGLRVVFGPAADAEFNRGFYLRRSFYLLSLMLIIGMTMLAGFLLWRDMHRESAIAELRSQFVSSVSHELKTPLTSIRMFAETLRIRKADERKHAEYLDTIIHESERLTRLLNNVLDFSQIERGQKTYQLLPTALDDVVSSAARIMEYPLARQGFRLRVSVPDAIPTAYADRDAVEQAILNLLTNAMKYSGQNRDIDLQLLAEPGSALIQVADRGIGISEKEREKIFEKFYRVPTLANQKIPGAGLGLALVAHIVNGHGGSVEVHSNPGEGSTFSIRLPLIAGSNGA